MSNPLGTISRAAIEAASDRKEAIFDLVANLIWDRDEAELTPPQRTVRTLLLYDNEVNNGGHLQYFHNQGIGSNDKLLRALAELGADCQREIFTQAARQAAEHPVEPVDSLEGGGGSTAAGASGRDVAR